MPVSTVPSLKFRFSTPYKGGTKSWSIRWHFSGGTPANLAAWTTLANAIAADLKNIISARTTLVDATTYNAGSEVPTNVIALNLAGTFVDGTAAAAPLECAAMVKWTTTQRTSKNHPIYLFQYLHDVYQTIGSADKELLNPTQRGFIDGFATRSVTGYSDGTLTLKRAGPRGAVAQAKILPTYITHRDFT